MRKNTVLFFLLIFLTGILQAKPVSVSVAQVVASNFYTQNSRTPAGNLSLAYTETSPANNILYYIFNAPTGFVIVAGDDALRPILGYSTEGQYVAPKPGTNFYYWMEGCASHINYVQSQNTEAAPSIAKEWNTYINNINIHAPMAAAVSPLCQTTWDQPSPYNDMCPGGSVTGCVATAMAQIMKYWSYPSHGIGSSFYYETSPENYGLLYANYDTSNYVWSAMPNSVTSANSQVAKLMYDCGVSVDMSYSPSESGAWVITADDKICAQASYVNYFGYNPKTIQGLKRKNYSDSAWMAMIKNELNNNRVVQYAGWDSVYGGHTWVCDGYDTRNYLHMNWGWSGYDNGYYELDTLNPNPYFFSKTNEILIGIEPPPIIAAFDATPSSGCAGITVNFSDKSMVPSLSSPITSRQWTFSGGNPSASNIQNPSVMYSTPGTYAVTLIVTNNKGVDTLVKKTYITVTGTNSLPASQSFEGVFPPAQWSINNPWMHAGTWGQYTGTGGYANSTHCMYYNNCSSGKIGERDQMYTATYDFSSVANPAIYFDVAYAPYDNIYSDTLAVYYSLDCGNTFTMVYLKGGMNLCTTKGLTVLKGANSDINGCFVPLSNNWRTDTIHIPAAAGQSNVMFSFENRSGNGSNLFIDNLNVPTTLPTGVSSVIEEPASLNVYPNPTNGSCNISFNTLAGQVYQVSIYNELGQCVVNKTVQNSNGKFTCPINLSEFGKGIYSVILKYGQKQDIQKIALL